MMYKTTKKAWFTASFLALGLILNAGGLGIKDARAQQNYQSLTITNDSIPDDIKSRIYSKPSSVREIRPQDLTGDAYYEPAQTLVTQKIDSLSNSLQGLKANIFRLSEDFDTLHSINEGRSAEYFAAVATINTQLQSGTTPGNPRLVERLKFAEKTLQYLVSGVSELNQIAVRASQIQSEANYLADEVRSTFRISGAIEEDHVRLSQIEDELDNTHVVLERILNNVSDDVTRLSAYLSAERTNLRTLTLAVANGDLYGRSLTSRPFSNIPVFEGIDTAGAPAPLAPLTPQDVSGAAPPGPLPLVKIRFNRPNVDYEQPVYSAMNEALSRYPNAQFELVAIHPTSGNAAQVAIESTRARRNAEKVLRTVTQMGLPPERVNLSYDQSDKASSTEVHIYIR